MSRIHIYFHRVGSASSQYDIFNHRIGANFVLSETDGLHHRRYDGRHGGDHRIDPFPRLFRKEHSMITGHGGNIYRLAETIGCPVEEIIDMSSNINPVGPIPGLIPLLKKKLISIKALPEADAASIIKATADR